MGWRLQHSAWGTPVKRKSAAKRRLTKLWAWTKFQFGCGARRLGAAGAPDFKPHFVKRWRRRLLHYEIRRIGDVAVVELSGELSSRFSPDLRRRIEEVTAQLEVPVVLDFARVVYVDSSGLGALILLQQQLAHKEQRMLIVNLTPQVKRVFDKVNLNRILIVCENIPEALFALQSKRVVALIGRKDYGAFYEEILRVNHLVVNDARDGEAALQLLAEGGADLFLVDVAETWQEVDDLLRRKQADPRAAAIPTLVVSRHETSESHLAELGVSEFFREPFEVDQFIDAIRRLA